MRQAHVNIRTVKLRFRKSARGDTIDLRYLRHARPFGAMWRDRCEFLRALDDDEREEVRYAVTLAGLRFARFWYKVRQIRPVAASVLTTVMFTVVWLLEEVIAFVILRNSIGPVSLAVDVWAGAATGWLAVAFGITSIRNRVRGIIRRDAHVFWGEGTVLSIALGLLGFAIVVERIEDAAVTLREKAVLQLGAVGLGAVGGLAAKRINRMGWRIVDRVLLVRDNRIRPSDAVLASLVLIAYIAHFVLVSGRRGWRDRNVVRRYVLDLENAAANIERASGLAGTLPWWHFRLRAQVAEPYAAVAAVVRAHQVKVLAAQDVERWLDICESLASGALAAVRGDWAALTANAPAPGPTRRGRLGRMVGRLSSTLVLLTCAIALPQILNLGAYGSSVRAILSVSAALALLPGDASKDASKTVQDTVSKAMHWPR